MRGKNTFNAGLIGGLIPFVALPLFIGCQNNVTGPEGDGDFALLAQEPAFESPGPRLLLAPGAAELVVGESLQFYRYWQDEADAYDDPDKNVQWESSDPAVATVGQDGLVQALRKGTVIISAQGDGGPGRATVIVR
jgi:hypothetical protein